MWDKMMLLLAAVDKDNEVRSISGARSVCIDSDRDIELKAAKISCDFDDSADIGGRFVGYTDAEGRCMLNVRISGNRFLDGEEFVRLMKATGSEAYGGEYDSEHFIYRALDKDCEVISPNHLMLPRTVCTLSMTATLAEDLMNGGRLVPGLHFKNSSGAYSAISAGSSDVGDVEMKGSSASGSEFSGLVHRAVATPMELPIRYDSVSLAVGTAVSDEPYEGQNLSFEIGAPLRAFDYYGTCDELDCVSGTLTRRVAYYEGADLGELSVAKYGGMPCFMLMLPERMMDTRLMAGGLSVVSSFSDYPETAEVIAAPTLDRLYLNFPGTPTPEEALAMLDESYFAYAMAEEQVTKLPSGMITELGAGTYYISVCSDSYHTVDVSYKLKE